MAPEIISRRIGKGCQHSKDLYQEERLDDCVQACRAILGDTNSPAHAHHHIFILVLLGKAVGDLNEAWDLYTQAKNYWDLIVGTCPSDLNTIRILRDLKPGIDALLQVLICESKQTSLNTRAMVQREDALAAQREAAFEAGEVDKGLKKPTATAEQLVGGEREASGTGYMSKKDSPSLRSSLDAENASNDASAANMSHEMVEEDVLGESASESDGNNVPIAADKDVVQEGLPPLFQGPPTLAQSAAMQELLSSMLSEE